MLHFPRETIIVTAINENAQIKLPVGLRSRRVSVYSLANFIKVDIFSLNKFYRSFSTTIAREKIRYNKFNIDRVSTIYKLKV